MIGTLSSRDQQAIVSACAMYSCIRAEKSTEISSSLMWASRLGFVLEINGQAVKVDEGGNDDNAGICKYST